MDWEKDVGSEGVAGLFIDDFCFEEADPTFPLL